MRSDKRRPVTRLSFAQPRERFLVFALQSVSFKTGPLGPNLEIAGLRFYLPTALARLWGRLVAFGFWDSGCRSFCSYLLAVPEGLNAVSPPRRGVTFCIDRKSPKSNSRTTPLRIPRPDAPVANRGTRFRRSFCPGAAAPLIPPSQRMLYPAARLTGAAGGVGAAACAARLRSGLSSRSLHGWPDKVPPADFYGLRAGE